MNLKNAKEVSAGQLAGLISNSCSNEFDLTFTPGTDKLTVGRFYKNNEQVYLLVNRLQEAITVNVLGQRVKSNSGKIRLLDPSSGEIHEITLSAQLQLEANRSLILMPGQEYLKNRLLDK